MTLGQGPVQGVGQGIFAQIADEGLVDLEGREVGRGNDGLLGESGNNDRLVAGGVDELVVEDLDLGVVAGELGDLVCNGLGIGESGNVLADTSKAQDNVGAVGTGELGAGLLANDNKVGDTSTDLTTVPTGQARVNTTAKSLVGAANDIKSLLALTLDCLGLGRLKDLTRGLTILGSISHGTLGTGELGGGDDLHGVGNLLDVSNRLEATLDFTQSGVAGAIVGDAVDEVRLAAFMVC